MQEGYERLEQKPFESHYRYFETVVAQPVERVWPHALNIGGWMGDHRLEPLDGRPGEVGFFEKVIPHGLGAEFALPHHHLYGIADVVPYKQISLEVFAEKGGSYGIEREWIGFDTILLVDLGSSTKVIVLLLVVHLGQRPDASPSLAERQHAEDVATRAQLERYFNNLHCMVNDATTASGTRNADRSQPAPREFPTGPS